MLMSFTSRLCGSIRHVSATHPGLWSPTIGLLVMAVVLWFSLFTAPVQAAPSDLDTSFNGTGIVSVIANDFAVLRNGRIVVVTNSVPQALGFNLSQYLTNGQLDTGFGTNGVVQTPILNGATATVIAQQADLKLVAAGWAYTGATYVIALARYLPSGQLDGAFGIGGVVTIPGIQNVNVTSMKILANGSILVTGYSSTGVLIRFTATGQLDPSFGVGGVVNVAHGQAESMAVQADGRILVAGNVFRNPGYESFLARYSADGAVDPAFGTGGVATDAPGGLSGGYGGMALAVQPDSKILMGSGTGGVAFGLLRYLSDGTLDPGFGNAGRVTTSGIDANEVTGIAIQTDGRILAVGGTHFRIALPIPYPPRSPTLVRYLASGHLDTSLANTGQLLLAGMVTGDPAPPAQALALQSDGKILIAGAGLVRLLGDPTDATRSIPTLSSGGLALLGLLMVLVAGWAARRRGAI